MGKQLNKNNNDKGQPNKAALPSLEGIPEEAKAILRELPEPERNKIALLFQRIIISRHSGPLPNPESYARYEEVLPGTADRIMSMAERQQIHRMELEKIAVTRQLNQSGTGQWLAAVLSVILIGSETFLVYCDHD